VANHGNSGRAKKLDIGTFHNGNSYALLFAAPKGDFESWQATFEHVAKSFRFTSAQGAKAVSDLPVRSGTSPLPSPSSQTSHVEKIKAIITDWKRAREDRDFNKFISLYDNSFLFHTSNIPRYPKEINYNQWFNSVQWQFKNSPPERYELHNMNIAFLGDIVQVVFDEEGRLDQRHYQGKRTLTLKVIGGVWKIVREDWILDETHLPTQQWLEERCYYGEWQEIVSNQFRWKFLIEKDILKIKRTDNSVSGSFHRSNDSWIGDLEWANGTRWDNIILYKADAECTKVKTNQHWWYKR